MAEPYLGQVILFVGDYAPEDWHCCDGTLLPIQQYLTLYTLLGTTFGGDGINTFALPDLRGRMIVGTGAGPGLTPRTVGQKDGAETISITQAQMPNHTHKVSAVETGSETLPSPTRTWGGSPTAAIPTFTNDLVNLTPFSALAVGPAGGLNPERSGGVAHDNMPPFIALTYIISLTGIYPDRP